MAKVKFSALMSDLRGKVNGSVFQKGRFGMILRTKTSPVQRNTPEQSQAKMLLTEYAQKWRTLDPDVMKAWNAAVEDFKTTDVFGDSMVPTGLNLYVQLNVNLSLIGQAELTKPPLPVNVPGIKSFTLDIDSTLGAEKFDIDFTPSPTDSKVVHMVYATRNYSAGKKFVKGTYRLIGTIASGSATPFDALTAYTAKFGTLTKDQMVSVKLVPVHKLCGIKFKAGAELAGKVK
jgi:hypothetical protein